MEKAMSDIETDHIGRPQVNHVQLRDGLAFMPRVYSVGNLLYHKRNGYPVFYKSDDLEKLIQLCFEDYNNGYLVHNGNWVRMRDNSESDVWR
jgi:hypothetical protein